MYDAPPNIKVVLIGSVFEETPEGLYHMDRIRMADDQFAAANPFHHELSRRLEEKFIFGEPE